MKELLRRLREELGGLAVGALGALLAAGAFLLFVVRPLEEQSQRLDAKARDALRSEAAHGPNKLVPVSLSPLDEFYAFFQRGERLEDWLSRLYASAIASGLDFRAAEYKLVDSRQRLERYQISLPISGSYPQIRTFMQNALVEIPIMSVDQVSFRRRNINDARVDAEVVVTLHLPRR